MAYAFCFDAVNSFGHAGFEIFAPEYVDSWAFLFFYPASFHRVHHTHFHANYALFMPLWDVVFGTYDRAATLDNLRTAHARSQV
eukprot:gene15788-24486_t